MTKKVSTSAVSPKRTIGAGLNYNYDQYDYYAGFPHRLERVGNMYYRYDGNGNVIAEREGGHATTDSRNATVYNDGNLYYTDYGFGLFQEGQTDTKVYERKYTWNERNLLSSSVDRQYAVTYRYGADGQRAAKYAVRGTTSVETMYFNQFWSSRTTATSEMLESKHIFVGTSRVVTKLHRKGDDSVDYEGKNRYYYHSDHLGSAQLVTDFKGLEYERIEYTPYGELWVEKTIAGSERLPFRFTGKEFDEETGLYYYGARYLDPKVSRWLSTDPAVGEYIPSAPVNDEARRRNGNLPGMGGIYNLVNFHLYHYAGNNPVRYIDPDGRWTEKMRRAIAYSLYQAYVSGEHDCDMWLEKILLIANPQSNIKELWGVAKDTNASGHYRKLKGGLKEHMELGTNIVIQGKGKSAKHVMVACLNPDGTVDVAHCTKNPVDKSKLNQPGMQNGYSESIRYSSEEAFLNDNWGDLSFYSLGDADDFNTKEENKNGFWQAIVSKAKPVLDKIMSFLGEE